MTLSIIWYFLCFILLCHDCVKPPKMINPSINDSRSQNNRRSTISVIAEDDPCSQEMWVFMKKRDRVSAQMRCEKAFNLFAALPSSNQEACMNAASPGCRPLPNCDDLIYGCTFVCEIPTGVIIWQTDEITGKPEEVEVTRKEVKHLKDIVKEYSEEVELRRKGIFTKKEEKKAKKKKRVTQDLILG